MIRLADNNGVWITGPDPDPLDAMLDQWAGSPDEEDPEEMQQRRDMWTSRKVGRFKRD